MPSTSKKFGETTPVATRSGSPRRSRSKLIWWNSTRPSKLASCCAVVVELLDRDAEVRLIGRGGRLLDQHQPIAVLVGQRLEQHAVDDAEDGGVGADPETQRQDGQQRQSRDS